MALIDHDRQIIEEWRPGVITKMRFSAINGALQLCIFDQWCDPGRGAPTHQHSVEELLDILEGEAEIWCGDETYITHANQSVSIPAGHWHGFRNMGTGKLHMRATLAAPVFEASYKDGAMSSRHWVL